MTPKTLLVLFLLTYTSFCFPFQPAQSESPVPTNFISCSQDLYQAGRIFMRAYKSLNEYNFVSLLGMYGELVTLFKKGIKDCVTENLAWW
ncbi:unnamed protein product [Moneuplotes crassus]|uniref:Uncharacterized protein n=1 Tax=Euplotes crassus TaxID=5936 RepID=A0AAD1Y5L2_EUPCR|nr:unnamed protein product [Moneuplotes crassus]